MNNKKLFKQVSAVVLSAAMVITMAPVDTSAKKVSKPKKITAPRKSMIKVGQTKTIVSTRKKAKKSNNDVKYVKFMPKNTKNIGISVKTSDDAIVSVKKESNGKYTYTGVTTGKAKLTITSRAKTSKGKKLKAKVDITVINPFRVTQTGSHTFTLSTAEKLDKVDPKDIKVVQEGSNIDNAVKKVELSADKLTATVTMHVPFVDQKKYEVTFGKEKDSFVASVGKPTAINIKTQTAVVNKPTKLEYAVVDDKGMDVTEVLDKAKITVDVTTKAGYYDANEKKITMWKVGDTAEVKVIYHSWTYDQKTGKENVIEAKATITCTDKSSITVTGLDKYTIADRILSWDTDEMKSVIAEGKNSKLWVRMKRSDGSYVDNKANPSDFSFEKINTAILYVYADGSIYATRQGTQYAKVTYFDGTIKYQYTLPVTVGAASKPTTLVLSAPYVVISKDATEAAPTVNTIKVLDQYGEEIESPATPVQKFLSGSDVVSRLSDKGLSKDEKIRKFGIIPNGKEGSGVYEISVPGYDLKISMTVSARDVSKATDGYKLEAETNMVDLNSINEGAETAYLDRLSEGIKLNFIQTKAGINDADANAKFKDLKTEKTLKEIKINGHPVNVKDSILLTQNDDGSLVFHPVAKQTDSTTNSSAYIIQTPKSGGYRIEATRTIDKVQYTVYDYIEIKGSIEMPKKDKTFKVASVPQKDPTTPAEIAEYMIDDIMGDKKDRWSLDQKKYAVVLRKNISSSKVSKIQKTEQIATSDWKDNKYYLDTAAFPAFLTDKKVSIWALVEGQDLTVDLYTPAKITGMTVTNQAEFIKGATKGEGVVTLTIEGENLQNASLNDTDSWTLDGASKDNYVIKSASDYSKVTATAGKGDTKATVKVTLMLKDGKTVADGDTVNLKYEKDATSIANAVIKVVKAEVNTIALKASTNKAIFLKGATKGEKEVTVTVTGDKLNLIKDWKTGWTAGDTFEIKKAEAQTGGTNTSVDVKLTYAVKSGKAVSDNNENLSFMGKSVANSALIDVKEVTVTGLDRSGTAEVEIAKGTEGEVTLTTSTATNLKADAAIKTALENKDNYSLDGSADKFEIKGVKSVTITDDANVSIVLTVANKADASGAGSTEKAKIKFSASADKTGGVCAIEEVTTANDVVKGKD